VGGAGEGARDVGASEGRWVGVVVAVEPHVGGTDSMKYSWLRARNAGVGHADRVRKHASMHITHLSALSMAVAGLLDASDIALERP
jgi:hypothetical protein